MSKAPKVGLDYYPFDVGFFDDMKIMLVAEKFGWKGELIAVKLLCQIYKEGYMIQWNDDASVVFAKRVMCDPACRALVKEVIKELVDVGFFDKGIYDSLHLLTSRAIQKRWLAVRKKGRLYNKIPSEHLLYFGEETENEQNNKCDLEGITYTENVTNDPPNDIYDPPNVTNDPPNDILGHKEKKRKEKVIKCTNVHSSPDGDGAQEEHSEREVLELFCEICGDTLGRPKDLTANRKTLIKARRKLLKSHEITYREYFEKIRGIPFLNGDGGRNWRADFDWVLKETNAVKILDGRYDNLGKCRDSPGKPSMYTSNAGEYSLDNWNI